MSVQARHTPGPYYSKVPGFNRHLWTRFIEDAYGNLIARINFANSVQSENEALATADLLAAAPTMYDALDDAPVHRLGEQLGDFMERYKEWYRTSRKEAIDKAEGGVA